MSNKSPTHLSVKKHNYSVPLLLLQSLSHILKCIPSSHETKKINTSQNTGTIITSMPSDHLNFIVKERKTAVQSSVKQLHFGGWKEKAAAAEEIKRLAGEGLGTRRLLAELGVITSLVCMLVESPNDQLRCLAVDALIELANGTFRNKALMAEAGLLDNLPNINKTQDSNLNLKLATLLLSISSLTKTHFSITPQNILPFLTNILIMTIPSNLDQNLKLKCLATLYNLSTKLETLNLIASSVALVHALISLSINQQTSKLALATLANLVLCSRGKKSIEDESSMVPQAFMEIMAWEEKPKCQELVMYILMMLANGSFAQRMKMRELGIVPLLLEVALLGSSSLAQKRALKMMEWFKDERHARMGVHSGPQENRFSISGRSPGKGEGREEECRRAVRRMVRQSLDQNLEMITRRGNGSQACSLIKSLVVTRSSKSLPY